MNRREPFLYVIISFFLAYAIYSLNPADMTSHWWGPGGIHVHHFSYGIVLLAVVGYFAMYGFYFPRIIGLVYGFGLFLVADEFGMWLKLREDEPDSLRQTGNITVAVVLLFILVVKYIRKKAR